MIHPGTGLRAVIFDLDGTLVDTADDFIPAVQQLREENDRPPMEPERIRARVSNGSGALVKVALNIDEENPHFEPSRRRLLALYSAILGRYARLYPGIPDLLDYLRSQNIAWGIATNKPREYTVPLLASLSLAPKSVVCPEDVAQAKPHPESLVRGCEDLHCAISEAIYLGDHLRDIDAGKRAGMYTIAAAYGYIEPGVRVEDWGADRVAHRSEDLRGLLFPSEERAYA